MNDIIGEGEHLQGNDIISARPPTNNTQHRKCMSMDWAHSSTKYLTSDHGTGGFHWFERNMGKLGNFCGCYKGNFTYDGENRYIV
uniref:Uncharacterized protein n=1 Tax=Megaselia scalaris TaxID=36166 RepID=T1GMD5_MEGSC